jgi:hypothetical protein
LSAKSSSGDNDFDLIAEPLENIHETESTEDGALEDIEEDETTPVISNEPSTVIAN